MSRIFVTGIGVVSPLGKGVDENHLALCEGRNGISSLELLKSKFSSTLRFGEVKIDNEDLKKDFKISNNGITRTSLLAVHAMSEALADSKLSVNQISSNQTALIVANTVGGMCLTDELYRDANEKTDASPYLSSYDCASTALFLQDKYQIKGICNTINTACSSSANAIMYGARLIKHGYAKRAIVGGSDSLAKFTINGFNSLGLLSNDYCKPFDEKRNGLNLAEGSGFLILESESEVGNKKIYAELTGYSNTNDSFHPSTLSENGDGPYSAMINSLKITKLLPSEIAYINTHGTGTQNNDLVESVAMKRVFETVPAFASSKSKIGHSLGASGSIEAVFSLLALHNQEIYPSLSFSNVIPETGLIPVTKTQKAVLNNVMCNSFGFGGNCSSLIFSKI
ncbi:MAG: beta-ketoacyl-[acyl-carrier-protein] synthase family protein [Bacteroidota bacterium]